MHRPSDGCLWDAAGIPVCRPPFHSLTGIPDSADSCRWCRTDSYAESRNTWTFPPPAVPETPVLIPSSYFSLHPHSIHRFLWWSSFSGWTAFWSRWFPVLSWEYLLSIWWYQYSIKSVMGQVDLGYRIFRNPSFYYNCFLTDKVLS